MRWLVVLLLAPLASATTTLTVLGVTTQQIVLSAHLDATNSCAVTTTPLIADVDPTVFASANDCLARDSSIISGSNVTIVIGSRRAQWDLIGQFRRSRSLQAATPYTVTITDAAGNTASASAVTRTVSAGNSWSEPLPVDPDRPGQYLLPDWMTTNQTESIIDPQTGVLLRRMMVPNQLIVPLTGNQAYQSAFALDTGWTGTCPGNTCKDNAIDNAFASPKVAAYTGTGSGTPGFLFVRHNAWQWGSSTATSAFAFLTGSADAYLARVTAQTTRSSCVGGHTGNDDCMIQVCLTIDGGASCWSPIFDREITTSMSGYVFPDPAATLTGLSVSNWKPPYADPLNRAISATSTTTVGVAADGITTTFVSQTAYRENVWGNGTLLHFTDGTHSADCALASISNTNGYILTLQSNTCLTAAGFTLPAASLTMTGPTFGLMIRKKTSTADTVKVGATSFSSQLSVDVIMPSSGALRVCGANIVGSGVYCGPGANKLLFWLDLPTGNTNFIGAALVPANGTGTDTWAGNQVIMSASTASNGFYFIQDSAGAMYGAIMDTGGKMIIVKAAINDPSHTPVSAPINNPSTNGLGINNGDTCGAMAAFSFTCRLNGVTNGIAWTDLTPSSLGQDLFSQLTAFTTGQAVPFVAANYALSRTALVGMQNGDLVGIARLGGQDSPGFIWVMGLGDNNPAHAGAAGPHIRAATPTFGSFPNRYCVIHGQQATAQTSGWNEYTPNPAGGNLNGGDSSFGWRATFTETSIPAYNPGSPIITLHIASDMVTFGSQLTNAQETIAPGDYLLITSSSSAAARAAVETMQVLTRAGSVITARRLSNQATIAGPATIYGWGLCGAEPEPGLSGYGTQLWWDYVNDPHGLNASYDVNGADPGSYLAPNTVRASYNLPLQHGAYEYPWAVYTGNSDFCAAGLTQCYQTFFGFPPDFIKNTVPDTSANTIALAAPFANATASGADPNVFQSHVATAPTQLPSNVLPRASDAFEMNGGMQTGLFTNLGGTGALWKMTTTAGATADNLSGNAILNRKRQPTVFVGGRYTIKDISSPATGDVITDSASDNFKACVARVAGECRAASAVGDIYFNYPHPYYVTYNGTTPGCVNNVHTLFDANNYRNMICVGNSTPGNQAIVDTRVDVNDSSGVWFREVTKGLSRWLIGDVFWNAQYTPDGSWLVFHTMWESSSRTEELMAQVPPSPPPDSMNRLTFNAYPVHLNGPTGTSSADVVFGYLEYGPVTSGFCNSRQEACVANTTILNQLLPYQLAVTDTFSHLACAAGCDVKIPLLSNRVAYWYPRYFNGGGTQIGGGPSTMQVSAIQ